MEKEYLQLIATNKHVTTAEVELDGLSDLSFMQLKNNIRDEKKLKRWSVAEISQALSGEVGELQNKLKKLYTQGENISEEEVDEEFADIQLYLLLLASKCKVDLGKSTIRKYKIKLRNKK